MGGRALGLQTAFDQPVGPVRLHNTRVAAPTDVAGPHGDDHLDASGNGVGPFGTVFADLHHGRAAAGTCLLRRFDQTMSHVYKAIRVILSPWDASVRAQEDAAVKGATGSGLQSSAASKTAPQILTPIAPVPPTAAAAVSEIDGAISSGTNAGAALIGTTSIPLRA
jgi:hypothetical protein